MTLTDSVFCKAAQRSAGVPVDDECVLRAVRAADKAHKQRNTVVFIKTCPNFFGKSLCIGRVQRNAHGFTAERGQRRAVMLICVDKMCRPRFGFVIVKIPAAACAVGCFRLQYTEGVFACFGVKNAADARGKIRSIRFKAPFAQATVSVWSPLVTTVQPLTFRTGE